jgi:short-subunit dehydrogenase
MKTILITGASDGIGKSLALRFSKEKHNLILFGRHPEKVEAVRKQCEANGATVEAHAFYLNDEENRKPIVDDIMSRHRVDVLINNAGGWLKVGELTELDEEIIQYTVNVNLTAQILLTRQLLDHMRGRKGTAIINIVSKSGVSAQKGQAVYTATKYGMRGFTDVLREDTKDDPIRIGAVYQAGTNTQMFKKAGDDFPIEKFTEPDDLAEVIAFMLSRPAKIWLNEVRVTY